MYDNIRAIDKNKGLRFTQTHTYHFAAKENFCPVLLLELPQVIREYFICFPNNQTGLPHALLGFEKGVNRYVSEKGEWLADYIPAYIRRYPFVLAKAKGGHQAEGEYTLAADMDAPHFQSAAGMPLFDLNGSPSSFLEATIKMLQGIEQQRTATWKAVRQLEQAGLFKMEQMVVKVHDQPVASIGGLRMVDEEKLEGLTAKPGPFLELVYAHLFSRANLKHGVLARKKERAAAADLDFGFRFGDDSITFQ